MYLCISNNSRLPNGLSFNRYRCIVIIEQDVAPEWRELVSHWLVKSGCVYMMAWGYECEAWDDSVDEAILIAFDYGEIPEDKFVMTTWHEDETLEDVFFFAKNAAFARPETSNFLLLHISEQSKEVEFKKLWNAI